MNGTPAQDGTFASLSLEATRAFWQWLQEERQRRWERRTDVPATNPYRRELKQEAKRLGEISEEFRRIWEGAQQRQPPPPEVDALTDGLDTTAVLAFSLFLRQGRVEANESIRRSFRSNKPETSTETEDAEAEEFAYRIASAQFHARLEVPAEELEALAPTQPPKPRPALKWDRVRAYLGGELFYDSAETPEQTLARRNAERARNGQPPVRYLGQRYAPVSRKKEAEDPTEPPK